MWGTFLLVLVAAGGGVIGATAFGGELTLQMKALAPGMMVMGVIFFMGTISGAHLNPAVTLAFAVRGNFPWRRVPGYIVAEVVGAVLAAWFLQLMYGGIINGATEPTTDVSIWVAMLTEAVLTLGLVSVILGTASGARNVGINGAIAMGAYIGLVSVWGAPVVGGVDEPGPLAGPRADRRELHQLLDLPGRPDHRRDDRRRLRVHPQGQANQGRRRRPPRGSWTRTLKASDPGGAGLGGRLPNRDRGERKERSRWPSRPGRSRWPSKRVAHPSVEERRARGKEARDRAPLSSHAGWVAAAGRPDPVGLLQEQDRTREPDLVPVRHGRMLVSPFTFYRGAAKIMAADLKDTPVAGLQVQLCGDAHLSNFGLFASPERELLFGLNDFDETLPGPFE